MDLDDLLKSIREEGKGGKIVLQNFLVRIDTRNIKRNFMHKDPLVENNSLQKKEKKDSRKRNDKIGFEQFVNKVLAKKNLQR